MQVSANGDKNPLGSYRQSFLSFKYPFQSHMVASTEFDKLTTYSGFFLQGAVRSKCLSWVTTWLRYRLSSHQVASSSGRCAPGTHDNYADAPGKKSGA